MTTPGVRRAKSDARKRIGAKLSAAEIHAIRVEAGIAGGKKRMALMTPEERSALGRQAQASQSDEVKSRFLSGAVEAGIAGGKRTTSDAQKLERMVAGRRRWLEGLSEEERDAHSAFHSKRSKKWHKSLSPKERAEQAAKIKAGLANRRATVAAVTK